MSTQIAQPLCMFQGESRTINLLVNQEDDTPLDLTGSTVYFTVALAAGGVAEITKTSVVPAEITILPQISPNIGRADIFLAPADTSSLPIGLHVYDVWVQLSTGENKPVVPAADFRINLGVTVVP